MKAIQETTMIATPTIKTFTGQEIKYPLIIRDNIAERRTKRHMWHLRIVHMIRMSLTRPAMNCVAWLKNVKRQAFAQYLEQLSTFADMHYFLWKVTGRIKRLFVHIRLVRDEFDNWTRRDNEKSELFSRHLPRTFQQHDITYNINPTQYIKPINGCDLLLLT